MDIKRVWAMPNHKTFQIKPIREFVLKYWEPSSVSIDPFARDCDLATFTNDLNPETNAEFHMESLDFVKELVRRDIRCDLVLFDPPYSLRQVKECYNGVGKEFTQRDGQIAGRWTELKKNITLLVEDGGIVLSFGWNSNGMGKKNGFEIIEILLVAHGSAHNDTICIAERKVRKDLFDG